MVLDWESEKLVSRERYEILEEARRRERERRAYWRNASYYPGAFRELDRSRERDRERSGDYETARSKHQDGRKRLRRRGRLETHDLIIFKPYRTLWFQLEAAIS
jgi:hypothetical protein